jgi:hypothetical protein
VKVAKKKTPTPTNQARTATGARLPMTEEEYRQLRDNLNAAAADLRRQPAGPVLGDWFNPPAPAVPTPRVTRTIDYRFDPYSAFTANHTSPNWTYIVINNYRNHRGDQVDLDTMAYCMALWAMVTHDWMGEISRDYSYTFADIVTHYDTSEIYLYELIESTMADIIATEEQEALDEDGEDDDRDTNF